MRKVFYLIAVVAVLAAVVGCAPPTPAAVEVVKEVPVVVEEPVV